MDSDAYRRAARVPVLLADLHFENPDWWRWILRRGTRPVRMPDASGPLRIGDGAPLLREILVEACVIARLHPHAARLAFDMSPAVVTTVAQLPASEIDFIVMEHAGDLQLRWSDNAVFWKNLLIAAIEGTAMQMEEVRLHSLQLLGSG
jgi:hypothetical protein